MKSTYTSIIIFLVLLGFVGYADHSLKKLCNNIIEECNEISNELETDNWTEVENRSAKITEKIKSSALISSVYINHTDFDILTNEALRLSSYTHSKDHSESLTSVVLLKEYASNIRNLHKVSIKNIF